MSSKSLIYYIIPVISLSCVMLASCASQKHVSKHTVYHTAYVKKASISLTVDGNKYNVSGQMQTVNDSLVVISLQPFAGVEMLQIRAIKDSLIVIDRMRKMYASASYKDVNKYIKPSFKYNDWQTLATAQGLSTGEMVCVKEYVAVGRKIKLSITYPFVIYDEPMRIRPQRTDGYEYVDAVQLLEQLTAGE